MDSIGLITLQAEVTDDVRAATEAPTLVGLRLAQGGDSGLENCAYQLARTFNIIEQMGLRIARAFENHIDDERGWHAELVHRLSIAVPGVRPALCEPEIIPPLRDLRGFRHVVAHAYDLQLEIDRVIIVVRHAQEATSRLPGLIEKFFRTGTAELADK